MLVRIQSDPDKIIPHHFDAASALFGAADNGYRWKYITYDEVESGNVDLAIPNNLYVGSVEFMLEVFNRVGISYEDIQLPKNSNRDSVILPMGDVRTRISNGEMLFVKSIQPKLFTGCVLDKFSVRSLSTISDSTLVRVYDLFQYDIVSEWRVYIDVSLSTEASIHNAIKGIKNYSGDEFISPPPKSFITNIILENIIDNFPSQYTIDIGILENGEVVVIEYNDMWAIGNYGIDNSTYFHLLRKRYFEIINKNINI
jgi:hypothetical protein